MEKLKGSPTEANPAKTSGSQANTTGAPTLNWEVFVTPGIPIVTPDRPPGVRETFFQAMASTRSGHDQLPRRDSLRSRCEPRVRL